MQSDQGKFDLDGMLRRHAGVVVDYFNAAMDKRGEIPARLKESMSYSFLAGGKRLRPALVLETFAACGGTGAGLPVTNCPWSSAVSAATAMEMIHTFSLIHDDLPAMDDDDLRRGRPTNHKVYGEAMAILAGDGLTTLAFEVIATDAEPAVAPRLIYELARSAGPEGMIGGQVLDMEGENQHLPLEALQRLHRMKTGALITSSCRLGAMAAGAGEDVVTAVTDYGRRLGLSFQIMDDVLDVTSTAEQMGKATGKDSAKGKNTYPAIMGLEGSIAEAQKQVDQAIAAVSILGDRAEGLIAAARFVVDRKS